MTIATRILAEEGFMALTLRRLATEAGISRTTPYLYFEDKADLLQKVCVRTFEYLIGLCNAAVEEEDNVLDKLTAFGRVYMQFGLDNPVLYRLVFAPEHPDDEVSQEVQDIAEEYKQLSAKPMQEAYEKGYFTYPPERLNPVLWASMHGLLCLRWSGHLSEDEAYHRVREDMEMILATGFLTDPAMGKTECED